MQNSGAGNVFGVNKSVEKFDYQEKKHTKKHKRSDMGVSENNGTPKSSILIGFSIINHFGGKPLFLETPIYLKSSASDGAAL